MKLAVNFSDSLLLLCKENPQLPVDYIKLPTIPFPECWTQFHQAVTYRNILPHLAQPGILDLYHPSILESFDELLVNRIIHQTNPPYLSTHLEATLEHFPEIKCHLHQNNSTVDDVLKNRLLPNIHRVKETISIPLLLENSPYYSWYHYYRRSCEPDYIGEICESGDCEMLLDIAHARISAWYFNIDVRDYLLCLPLSRVKEIHLSGVLEAPMGIWDSHTELHEEDYQLFKFALEHTKPDIVTIEYGGYADREWNPLDGGYIECLRNNPDELREMIFNVYTIMNRIS